MRGLQIGDPQSAIRNRSAFTFTEVMFAVILLGIGFIMIAAMFPVAIRQSKTSADETTATAVARAAMAHIQSIADELAMPEQGLSVHFDTNPPDSSFWRRIEGSLIHSDPRYAWTALYRRDKGDVAQVFVFVLQAKNRPTFSPDDVIQPRLASDATKRFAAGLQPKSVKVTLSARASDSELDSLGLAPRVGTFQEELNNNDPSAEGAFVAFVHGGTTHVVRLGRPRPGGGYDLAPGGDLGSSRTALNNQTVDGFLIGGRTYQRNARSVAGPPAFNGEATAVTVFTGFVQVR